MADEKTPEQVAAEKTAADKTAADKAKAGTYEIDGQTLTKEDIKQGMELRKLKGSLDEKGQKLNEQERRLQSQAAEIEAARKQAVTAKRDDGIPKPPSLYIANPEAEGGFEINLDFDRQNAEYQATLFRTVQQGNTRGQVLEAATIQINNRMVEQSFKQTHGLKGEEFKAIKDAAIQGGLLDNVGTQTHPVYLLTDEALEKAQDLQFAGQVRESLIDPDKLMRALAKLAGQADLGFQISKNPPRTGAAGGELQPLLDKAKDPATFKLMTPEEKAILVQAGILPRQAG